MEWDINMARLSQQKIRLMDYELMANEKKQRDEKMAHQKQMAEVEKVKSAKLLALGVKRPKSSSVDISDKWFKESPDGTAGIDQALREKAIIDHVEKTMPSVPIKATSVSPVSPKP